VADLDDQKAAIVQMRAGLRKHAADDLEPVFAAGQRHARLCEILLRQPLHGLLVYIRRIGNDHVVTPAQPGKQIAADEVHAIAQFVVGHVMRGHLERIGRQVRRVDQGIGKSQREQNGQATRTGAKIQNLVHGLALDDPGIQFVAQQFRYVRARYDHALVDVKTKFSQPGFAGQIGCRDALLDAPLNDGFERFDFCGCQSLVEHAIEVVQRQFQGM